YPERYRRPRGSTAALLQRLHDVCLVRPPQESGGSAVVRRRHRELGHRAVRISAPGAGQPDRVYHTLPRAIKILQEVITLAVFVPFAVVYMRQPLKLDYLWAPLCIVGAVYFIFRAPATP